MNKKEERITCLVPIKILPNKQAFMDLGFTFKVIPNSDLCLATLPEGWISVAGKDYWITLIDEKGRERGSYIYEPHPDNFMELHTRFYISNDFDPDDRTTSFIYIFVRDRINRRVLFSLGKCIRNDSHETTRLIIKAKEFLNLNYPDWEVPNKYWDLEEDVIKYCY